MCVEVKPIREIFEISNIWASRPARKKNPISRWSPSVCGLFYSLKQLWAPWHSRCSNWPGLFYHSCCMLFYVLNVYLLTDFVCVCVCMHLCMSMCVLLSQGSETLTKVWKKENLKQRVKSRTIISESFVSERFWI